MRIILLFLLTLVLIACRQSPNQTLSLNGSDWQMQELDAQDWQPAQVPGSVQSDLLRLEKIPDPFLKILCALIKLYDHKRVNIKPKYLIIMRKYSNCETG